ncbi:MAG: hypothetical protein ACPG32_04160 [Akkermansiaceae bacterium]
MDHSDNHENFDNGAKRQFESCGDAFSAGRSDATSKAREAAPKLKEAVSGAVHDLAYGAAYGVFFAGAFANEFVPQSVKDGIAKGAKAGRNAADKMRSTAKNQDTDPGDETLELPAPA